MLAFYADDMKSGLASVIVRDKLHVGSDHVVELWRRSDADAMDGDEKASNGDAGRTLGSERAPATVT